MTNILKFINILRPMGSLGTVLIYTDKLKKDFKSDLFTGDVRVINYSRLSYQELSRSSCGFNIASVIMDGAYTDKHLKVVAEATIPVISAVKDYLVKNKKMVDLADRLGIYDSGKIDKLLGAFEEAKII